MTALPSPVSVCNQSDVVAEQEYVSTTHYNDTMTSTNPDDTPSVVTGSPSRYIATCSGAESAVHEGDIGIPKDDEWEIVDAHEKRYCYFHGCQEWLISFRDTWMHAEDFKISKACETLAAELEGHQKGRNPLNQQPATADCQASLWLQKHTPIGSKELDGSILFEIRWKLQWIPERNIKDLEWLRKRYRENIRTQGLRRSVRIEREADSHAERKEAIMEVISLDL